MEGGLLGAISSSIDDVQQKLDLNQNFIDEWRLRADRAANEVGRLVNQTTERSPWSVAGDFLLLSGVWIGAFTLLTLLGRVIVRRLGQRTFFERRHRLHSVLGYVVPYTLPALVCLPLTLYVSHFLPTSVGRALALCFAYATSSGIFSTSMLLCVIVMFNVGHKRPAVQIIRDYCPKPLFLIGFLAALSDALTSPQIARQLGGNITSSIAVFTGLFATVIFGVLVVRLRRPVAHLIRNRPLAQRLKHPALQQSLRIFSGLWYWPILLMVLVSAINLIGAGDDNQKVLRCALFTTILLIGTVFLSTVLQHLFKSRSQVAISCASTAAPACAWRLPPKPMKPAIRAAIGLMGAARDKGLVPGKDIAVVGFNDIPLANELTVPLTSVRLPLADMGQRAVELLLKRDRKSVV